MDNRSIHISEYRSIQLEGCRSMILTESFTERVTDHVPLAPNYPNIKVLVSYSRTHAMGAIQVMDITNNSAVYIWGNPP
ncbi:hypothetical protein IGI04_007455 [Brassica rapa subsp. trilocularis]|uniref:Uncharacterized protein n=1 Tax=Brassica rapa subsp. trilocularis TaxID=1813537 RepID=A0ABQ7NJS4_BRACM|nr:hypothetical protein IGI04_007455 [Brassica rapa subsp. trilocularis]